MMMKDSLYFQHLALLDLSAKHPVMWHIDFDAENNILKNEFEQNSIVCDIPALKTVPANLIDNNEKVDEEALQLANISH